MDLPATVTDEERAEIARERALSEGVEPPPPAPAPAPPAPPAPPTQPESPTHPGQVEEAKPVFSPGGRLSILDLLKVYEIGKGYLPKRDHERWQLTYSLAWSVGGIYVGTRKDIVETIVVFWRTDNPNVKPSLGVPVPTKNGNFIYICWMWNNLGIEAMRRLRDHFYDTCDGAKFAAHHDHRKGGKRGELITIPLSSVTEGVL